MKDTTRVVLTLACLLALAACKPRGESQADPAAPEAASAPVVAQEPAAPSAPASDAAAPASAASAAFDVDSVPLSTATLGEFPYFTLPQGYVSNGTPKQKAFARFPFWVNGSAHWVEGRFHEVNIHTQRGKDYSMFEVQKNLDSIVEQLGGRKVSTGEVPSEVSRAWSDEIRQGFIMGLGDLYNEPVTTYLVRRSDGNIWIHFVQNTAEGWVTVGQEKGFEQTSAVLPASALKKQIDATGKVALQVHFATDQTAILPASQPQIDQVAQLLSDDAALRLAVNGHTDNSGDAAHNQQLSDGRAKAVVAALVAKGIAADRLSAKGFGDTQPVADNASEDGKAKNRRVELVKQA